MMRARIFGAQNTGKSDTHYPVSWRHFYNVFETVGSVDMTVASGSDWWAEEAAIALPQTESWSRGRVRIGIAEDPNRGSHVATLFGVKERSQKIISSVSSPRVRLLWKKREASIGEDLRDGEIIR